MTHHSISNKFASRRTAQTSCRFLLTAVTLASCVGVACSSGSNGTGGYGGSSGSTPSGSAGAPAGGTSTGGSAGAAGGTPTRGGDAEGGAGGAATLANFAVKRTDLDSDQPGAAQTDPNLINAWGIAIVPATQVFWVSSNHGGSTPVYDASGAIKPLDPKVPPLTGTDPGVPTGEIFNSGTGFMADKFVVDTEDGQVMGWPGTLGDRMRPCPSLLRSGYPDARLAPGYRNAS
jgi:hypothetical protein